MSDEEWSFGARDEDRSKRSHDSVEKRRTDTHGKAAILGQRAAHRFNAEAWIDEPISGMVPPCHGRAGTDRRRFYCRASTSRHRVSAGSDDYGGGIGDPVPQLRMTAHGGAWLDSCRTHRHMDHWLMKRSLITCRTRTAVQNIEATSLFPTNRACLNWPRRQELPSPKSHRR